MLGYSGALTGSIGVMGFFGLAFVGARCFVNRDFLTMLHLACVARQSQSTPYLLTVHPERAIIRTRARALAMDASSLVVGFLGGTVAAAAVVAIALRGKEIISR